VARPVLLEDQVTVLIVALVGLTVADRVVVTPVTPLMAELPVMVIPVTARFTTVTYTSPYFPLPSFAAARMVTEPAFTPVTTAPDTVCVTLAMVESKEVQVRLELLASKGDTAALKERVSPTIKSSASPEDTEAVTDET
jgi:hypothetical protein